MSDEHKLSSSTSSRRSRRGKSMTDAAFLPDGGLSEPSLAVSGPSYKDPAEGRLDASFDDAIPLPAADVPAPESPDGEVEENESPRNAPAARTTRNRFWPKFRPLCRLCRFGTAWCSIL